jgi:hypothetical protein
MRFGRFGRLARLGMLTIPSAILLACNMIVGFGELEKVKSSSVTDGGDDDDEGRDSRPPKTKDNDEPAPAGPRCDPTKPFGEPVLMTEFDGQANTHSAVMTEDELEVVYWKGAELRHGRRVAPNDSAKWQFTTEPMDPQADFSVSIAAGGLKLYYWRLDGTGQRVMVATRAALGDVFGLPRFVPAPSNRPVFVVASDDVAYYAQITDGAVDHTIRKANVTGNGVGLGIEVPNIHLPNSYDNFPITNASETALYFNSTRMTGTTLGGTDIWVSRRANKKAEWGVAEHVPELSSPQADVITWVSNDDCEALIDRASHIFRARRP